MWFVTLVIIAILAYLLINALSGKKSSTTGASLPSAGTAADRPTGASADTTAGGTPSTTAAATAATPNAATPAAARDSQTHAVDTSAAHPTATPAPAANAAAMSASGADLDATLQFLDSGNAGDDIREMFKVLNLRENDASRLSLSKEQFQQLKTGDDGAFTADTLNEVASRLRFMIA